MSTSIPGRHRAQRRNVLKPLARASATMVAAGGLVASMSGGAQATPAPAAPPAPSAQPVALPSSPAALPAAPVLLPTTPRWSTIRYGARGNHVKTVQRIAGSYADGVFGPKTLAAVKRYQSRNGLVVDGIVGPKTAAKMGLTTAAASRSSATRSTSRSTSSSGVVGIAASYTGIMYRYGGSTPAGFDCSGFTQFVFGKAGISLPRTAEAQRRATTRVSSPRVGDLVFWGAPAYHVGIYAGNGMIYDSGRAGLPTQKRKMFSGYKTFGRVG
jgi:peptidoglycan DL-endopeptidase CwlO